MLALAQSRRQEASQSHCCPELRPVASLRPHSEGLQELSINQTASPSVVAGFAQSPPGLKIFQRGALSGRGSGFNRWVHCQRWKQNGFHRRKRPLARCGRRCESCPVHSDHVVFRQPSDCFEQWLAKKLKRWRDPSVWTPTDDRESALQVALEPGAYTAVVSSGDGSTGVGLVEVYGVGDTKGP